MSAVLENECEVKQLPPPTKPSVTEKIVEYWQNHADDANRKKAEFVEALREKGKVRAALAVVSTDRRTLYYWRNTDPEFREAWDYAIEDVTDEVEESLYDQAVSRKNVVATIVWLKAHRAKYRDRLAIDVNAMDREIEQRLSTIDESTKGIIANAIGGPPPQLTE